MDKFASIVASGIGQREAEDSKNKRAAQLQKVKKHSYRKGSGNPKNKRTNPRAMKRAAQRTAGLASINRGKRGVTIKNCGKGNDVAGLVGYATLDKKDHKLLDTNCDDFESFIKTTNQLKKLKPNIKDNVQHVTVSLSDKSNFALSRFDEMIAEIRKDLSIDDSYPYAVVQHFDTPDHPHCHLIWSRISVSGQVHDDNSLSFRCASAEQHMEDFYQLNCVEMKRQDVKQPNKKELEMQLRIGELSNRAKFQALCNDAMTDCDNIVTYFNRLQNVGFDLEITTQSEGSIISGIVYHLNGETMKASDLGKKFTASGLSKHGLNYEQNRDFKSITEIKNATALKQLRAAGGDLANDELSIGRADGRKNSTSSAGHESIGSNPSRNSENLRNRDGEQLSQAQRNAQTGSDLQRAAAVQPTTNKSDLGYSNNSHQRASDLICDLANASTESIAEYGHKSASPANHRPASASYAARSTQIKALGGRSEEFQISILLPEGAKQTKGRFKFEKLTPEQQAEEDAFYSLPENKNKPRRKMLKRTPKNAEDFRTFAGFCAALNAEEADIYIAPHPASKHSFVLIDDLTIENVNRMKSDGLEPSLLVETSLNNFQSWVKLNNKTLSKKQLLECSRILTKQYHGDIGAIGSDRIGRLAGFTNRKEKHKNAQGLQPYCLLKENRQEVATNGHIIIAQADELIANDVVSKERLKRIIAIESASDYLGYGASPTQFFQTEAKKILNRYGNETDLSRLDHMVCKTMHESHKFSSVQIAQALREGSPDISRKNDVEDYIKRTIEKSRAAAELQRQLQQQENEEDRTNNNDFTN